MDERKRIMDLVKKGVITSQEAIVLLEKLGQESADSTNEDPSDQYDKKTEYYENETADYINNLKKRIEQVKGRLTVLNTLDDFQRLDGEDITERDELQKSLIELQAELNKVEKEQRNFNNSKNNNFFGFDVEIDSEKLENQARNIASKLKKTIINFSDNFELRDFNVKVPKFSRSKKIINTNDFTNDKIKNLNINIFNGDIIIRKSIDGFIHERISYRVLGNLINTSPEHFFENNTINEVTDATLNIQIPRRIKATIELSFPEDFTLINAKLAGKNTDFDINDIKMNDLILSAANGEVNFNFVELSHCEVNAVNGLIIVENSDMSEGLLNTVNGSVRTVNSVTNLEISSVNGDIVLSNIGSETLSMDAHVVNGDIKMSVPKELNYVIKAETKNGLINNRLMNAKPDSTDKNAKVMLIEHKGSKNADLQFSTISGSIYLKDSAPLEGSND